MLLVSKVRFELLFSSLGAGASGSLGDSKALGIAGTGGTSSSSRSCPRAARPRTLGVGKREAAKESRCWRDWVDVRTVTVLLTLELELAERPEL